MTSITIFGNGNMGQAIAGVLARGGADVQHIGSADTAAELQAQLPGATVLKAFNTNFAATLASGQVGTQKTTVLVAGDDAAAKAALVAAVEAGGLAAVDAGALSRAHELEAIGFLQLTLAVGEKIGWTGGFALSA